MRVTVKEDHLVIYFMQLLKHDVRRSSSSNLHLSWYVAETTVPRCISSASVRLRLVGCTQTEPRQNWYPPFQSAASATRSSKQHSLLQKKIMLAQIIFYIQQLLLGGKSTNAASKPEVIPGSILKSQLEIIPGSCSAVMVHQYFT